MSISWPGYGGILLTQLYPSGLCFAAFQITNYILLISISSKYITQLKVMTATGAEIKDVMEDGMAGVEMEATGEMEIKDVMVDVIGEFDLYSPLFWL